MNKDRVGHSGGYPFVHRHTSTVIITRHIHASYRLPFNTHAHDIHQISWITVDSSDPALPCRCCSSSAACVSPSLMGRGCVCRMGCLVVAFTSSHFWYQPSPARISNSTGLFMIYLLSPPSILTSLPSHRSSMRPDCVTVWPTTIRFAATAARVWSSRGQARDSADVASTRSHSGPLSPVKTDPSTLQAAPSSRLTPSLTASRPSWANLGSRPAWTNRMSL
mmetsp:Transcript_28308/g.70716  ORF Transcript_28308/g.70716 Transcript_28308/m.70716 type:complete len:221 (+) Transcript_28308:984-1646(+)